MQGTLLTPQYYRPGDVISGVQLGPRRIQLAPGLLTPQYINPGYRPFGMALAPQYGTPKLWATPRRYGPPYGVWGYPMMPSGFYGY
jgi:hypothetical protein